jgi:hypothetical protein
MSERVLKETKVALATIQSRPYSALSRIRLAEHYASLNYPDLASGAAYMALLLCDEIYDEDAEFHEQAFKAAEADRKTQHQASALSKSSLSESRVDDINSWIQTHVELQT